MTELEAWVAARVAGAPESLRARVRRAVTGTDGAQPGDVVLRRAADAMAAASLTEDATETAALLLLTADTLVTLACQWAAETDPARLGAIA